MARPVDHRQREALLEAAAAHLRESGDADASLDAIAARAGTTRRMLVHYFGTKDALVAEALDRCATEGRAFVAALPALLGEVDRAEAVGLFWQWLTADGGRSMRLFFSTSAQALADDGGTVAYPAATTVDWVSAIEALGVPTDVATLVLGTVRGLVLDRMLTGDTARTDAAIAALQRALAAAGPPD